MIGRLLRAFLGGFLLAALSYLPLLVLCSVVGFSQPALVARAATSTIATVTSIYLFLRSGSAARARDTWRSADRGPTPSAAPGPPAVAPRHAASRAPAPLRDAVPFGDARTGGFPSACTYRPEVCGRPAVDRRRWPGRGEVTACELCRHEIATATDQSWTVPLVPAGVAWAYCECGCGHVALARLDAMDRTAVHLRCPDCVASGHPPVARAEDAFAADPRFPPRTNRREASGSAAGPSAPADGVPFTGDPTVPRPCACGRSAVGIVDSWMSGSRPVCERERVLSTHAEAASRFHPWDGGQHAYCECACGHVTVARLDRMERSGTHLRCPDCVAAGHPSGDRTEADLAADPRFPRGR